MGKLDECDVRNKMSSRESGLLSVLKKYPILIHRIYTTLQQMTESSFWAEDITVLFRGEHLLRIWPTKDMSSDAKLNSVVRLSIYVAIVLLLFGKSYLVLYVPLVTFLITYGMHMMNQRTSESPTTESTPTPVEGFSLYDDSVANGQHPRSLDSLQHSFPPSQFHRANVSGTPTNYPTPREPNTLASADGGLRKCTPSTKENPFMNILIPDIKYHPTKPEACTRREQGDIRKQVESNFDARAFRDVGDVWAHAGGQRQFFTMPWTTTPNDPQGEFGQWLYDVPPTKKEQGLILKPLRQPNGLL